MTKKPPKQYKTYPQMEDRLAWKKRGSVWIGLPIEKPEPLHELVSPYPYCQRYTMMPWRMPGLSTRLYKLTEFHKPTSMLFFLPGVYRTKKEAKLAAEYHYQYWFSIWNPGFIHPNSWDAATPEQRDAAIAAGCR